MDENNNNVPAAGEQIVFDAQPKTEEPKVEVPEVEVPVVEVPKAEDVVADTAKAEEPKIEIPQAEIPQPTPQPAPEQEIPKVEEPQTQYQQTPPPVNNYQYQNQAQNTYQNQAYNQVPPTPVQVEPDKSPMTMGEWLVTMLLMMIPCVNIVLLFVWAFGDKTGNLNRKNFAKAQLIIMGVILALYVLVMIIMVVAIGASYSY